MKYTVDARGKQCPIPVVETKKMVERVTEQDEVETLVDNEIAVQNLEKMAKQKHMMFQSEKLGPNSYRTVVKRTEGTAEDVQEDTQDYLACRPDIRTKEKTVVVLSSDKMGEGDEALGTVLMKGFIYALTGRDELPDTVLMYNNGAKLSVEGSDFLEDLKLLESQGVEILTCGTCLNHYGLTEKLAVGSITNMYVICEKMMEAGRVVKP